MATVMLPEGPPAWTRSTSTSSAIAPWIELTLSRNLADHLFPNCATEEELRVIEARVLDALEKVGLGSRGYYLPMHELSTIDQYQLVERRLASEELLHRTGPRGVFLREDQVLSVMVNGVDHLTIRCTLSGHAGEAAWQELNNLDSLLARLLDFAFDGRRGYLTSVLDNLGTGLRARCLMHLPALRGAEGLLRHAEAAARLGMLLCGLRRSGRVAPPAQIPPELGGSVLLVPDWAGEYLSVDTDGALFGAGTDTVGDLYMLCSHATLGRSEPEVIFGMQHIATELIAAEEAARAQLLSSGRVSLEDRVGRATGVALGARLIGFEECYALLSSLRLGAACGMVDHPSMVALNDLSVTAQGAHLAKALPGDPGPFELSEARAGRFQQLLGALPAN